jgi:hypothetical protein
VLSPPCCDLRVLGTHDVTCAKAEARESNTQKSGLNKEVNTYRAGSTSTCTLERQPPNQPAPTTGVGERSQERRVNGRSRGSLGDRKTVYHSVYVCVHYYLRFKICANNCRAVSHPRVDTMKAAHTSPSHTTPFLPISHDRMNGVTPREPPPSRPSCSSPGASGAPPPPPPHL